MTSKDRIKAAMTCQPVDRIPWVPFVGVHAAKLLGLTATAYLQSTKSMIEGVNKAIDLYRPDGIPVAFDLQLEAEALGCELQWADENPPAVIQHPLANGTALSDLTIPTPDQGRIASILKVAKQVRKGPSGFGLVRADHWSVYPGPAFAWHSDLYGHVRQSV